MGEPFAGPAIQAGFNLLRLRPFSVACWAAFILFFSMGDFALTLATPPPTPGGQAGLLLNFRLLLQLSLYAVIWAAAYRAFSTPQPDRFAYMRMSWLEIRLAGYWMLVGIAGISILAIVSAATAILLTISGSTHPSFMAVLFIGQGVGCVALVPVLIRLSMLPLALIDQLDHPLRASWRLTGGIFWPLGRVLFAVVFLPIVALALFVAFDWSQRHLPDMSTPGWTAAAHLDALRKHADPLRAFLDPIRLTGFVITAGIETISIVIVAGVVSTRTVA